MKDGDGGQSLIAAGIRAVTSADAKQNQLHKELVEVQNRLLQLSRGWVVDPDTNVDREKRLLAAKKVIDWLTADEEAVYYRVHALQESLCIADGEELELSDCVDVQSRRHGDPLPRQLQNFSTNGRPSPYPSASRPTATRTRKASPGSIPTTSTPSLASCAITSARRRSSTSWSACSRRWSA